MMLLTLTLSAVLLQDTVPPPVIGPEALRLADSIAAAEFAKDSLGSITVGIVSGPALVWAKSYGYADSARTRPATPATVYRVASVTKQLTVLMLLQQVQAGRVRLSDPVERYFPEVRRVQGTPPESAPITLVQLATMTSGLARDPDDERASRRGATERWREILVAALPRTSYANAPGARYRYSNVGYAILGAALENASGEGYVAYQHRHLLQPLGMTSSAFVLTPALAERLATGVDWDDGTLVYSDAAEDHRQGLGFSVPSGGLYSTVGDLAKLVSLEMGFGPDSVLGREMLALRDEVPVAAYPQLDYGYGLGYQTMRWGDTVAVGHSGNLAGYTSMVLYDPERRFGVVVLRSAGGGEADAGRLAGRVLRRIRAELMRREAVTGGSP
ncbi:MAG TPA: serine hydrolase domain-containing protein [Longimicrobium sp.]|nr:serine hydrolase domain-containing protein [Longimicrobium sp.]